MKIPSVRELSENPFAPRSMSIEEFKRTFGIRSHELTERVTFKAGEVFQMDSGGRYLVGKKGNFIRLDKQLSKKARKRKANQIRKEIQR